MRRLSVLLAAPVLALMLTAAEPPAAPDSPLADAALDVVAAAGRASAGQRTGQGAGQGGERHG